MEINLLIIRNAIFALYNDEIQASWISVDDAIAGIKKNKWVVKMDSKTLEEFIALLKIEKQTV